MTVSKIGGLWIGVFYAACCSPSYASEYEAIKVVAGRLGMNPETLRKWVRQTEIDAGEAPGVSSEERRELRELRRKNRELESTIEILKAATSFFARECDPRHR